MNGKPFHMLIKINQYDKKTIRENLVEEMGDGAVDGEASRLIRRYRDGRGVGLSDRTTPVPINMSAFAFTMTIFHYPAVVLGVLVYFFCLIGFPEG